MKYSRTTAGKPAVPTHALRRLEMLEARVVPAALSVADVSVREGPASLGAIDPAGAAALSLDHPRMIG